jgi:hypothetical protein
MVLSLEQNTFMSYYRNGTLQNGEWVYSNKRLQERIFTEILQMTNNIWKANLIPHVRRIVDRFVATRSIEKGKTVGRPPVKDEIVEDLRQRMEQNSKKIP